MNDINELKAERNLYKGKYRAFLKLIIRSRNKLIQVTDHIEDEVDRCYFGSSNHADDLKELYHEMMSWIWDAEDETNRMKSDPYADIRKQRARAKSAEAERDALRDRVAELEGASQWRTMSSAPRDGSYVWLWNKHASASLNAPQAYRWSTHYSVFGLGGCWTDGLCTMGDGVDFDFWCAALPAQWVNPYEALSQGDQP